ncbi:hypothetical protein QBC32DRAFT_316104 [Pseudoneurospora amorphoporcata]|uniref:Uncharacterized protein n=1 Tax=Pseudoneurospora amorphoporcata TaxID=241081 RepID=A0AAN6NQV5_9PEZI|nr:hypothetical protein QBC32DRAFT_316104 [Pseudoneurospora amorphoporcata]
MSLSKPSKEPTPPPTPPGELAAAADIPLLDSSLALPPTDSPFWTFIAEEICTVGDMDNDNNKTQEIPDSMSDVDNTNSPRRNNSTSEERSLTPPLEAREEDQQLVDASDDDNDNQNEPKLSNATLNNMNNSTSTSEDRNPITPPPETMSEQDPPLDPELQPQPDALELLPKIPDILAKISQRITDLQAAEDGPNLEESQQKVHDVTCSILLDTLAVASIVMAEEIADTEAKAALVNAALVPLPDCDKDENDLASELEEEEELDSQQPRSSESNSKEKEKYTLLSMLPSFQVARRAAAGGNNQVETVLHHHDNNSNNNNDHNLSALQYPPPPPGSCASSYSADADLDDPSPSHSSSLSLVPQFIAANLQAQGRKPHAPLPVSSQDDNHLHVPDVVVHVPTCTSYDDIDWSDLFFPAARGPSPASASASTSKSGPGPGPEEGPGPGPEEGPGPGPEEGPGPGPEEGPGPQDNSSLMSTKPTLTPSPSSSSLSKASLTVQVDDDPADVPPLPLSEDDDSDSFEVPLPLSVGVEVDDGGSGLFDYDYKEDLEGVGAQYEEMEEGEANIKEVEDESDSSQLFVVDNDDGDDDRRPTKEEKGKGKLADPDEEQEDKDKGKDKDKRDSDSHGDDTVRSLSISPCVHMQGHKRKWSRGSETAVSVGGKVVPTPGLDLSQHVINTSTDDEVQQQQLQEEQMQSPRSPPSPYTSAAAAPVVTTLGTPIAEYADMGSITLHQQVVVAPKPQRSKAARAPCPIHGTRNQRQPATATPKTRVYVHKPRLPEPKDSLAPSSPCLLSRPSPYAAHKSSLPRPRESLLHGSEPYTAAPYPPAVVVPWDLQKKKQDLHGLADLPVPERMPTYTRLSTTTDTSPVMPMWFEGFDAQEWSLIEPNASIYYRRIRHDWHQSLPQWPPYIIGPTPLILEMSQIGKDGLGGHLDMLFNCERYAPPGFKTPCQQLLSFTQFIRECLSLQEIRDITVPDFRTVHECKTWLETVTKNGRMLSLMAIHCHVERLRGGVAPGTHEFLDAVRDMGCQLGWNENVYFSKAETLTAFKHVARYDSSSTTTPFSSRRGDPGEHFCYGQGKSTDYCIALRENHPLLNVRVTLAALNTLNFEWMRWIGHPDYWVKTWDQCDEVVLPLRNSRLAEMRLRRKDLWTEATALNGRVDGWFEHHPEPPKTAHTASDAIAPRVCPSCQGLGHDHDESFCTYDTETPTSSGDSSPRGPHGLHPFPTPRPLPEPPRPGFSSLAEDGQRLLTEGDLASISRSERMLNKMDRNLDKHLSRLNPSKRQRTEATNVEAEKAAEPDTRTETQKERQRRKNRKKKEQQKEAKKKQTARAEVVAESKAQIYEHLKTGKFSREKVKDVLDKTMAKIKPKPGAIGQYGLPKKEEGAFRDWAKTLYIQHLRLVEAGEGTKLMGMFDIPADISEEDFYKAVVENIGLVEFKEGGFEIGWKLNAEEGTESQKALLDSPQDADQDALDNQLGQASTERSSAKEQESPEEARKPQPQHVQHYFEPVPSSQDTPEQHHTPVPQPKELDDMASAHVSQPAAEPSTGPEAASNDAPGTGAAPTVAPTDTPTSNLDDTSAAPNPPPLDKSKEASKAKKERRKVRKRLDREKEEARLREEAAAREELRRQAEARHQAELDRKIAEAQRKLDEEKARRLEQNQKEEAARLQRAEEEEIRFQKLKDEEAKKRKEEEVRKRTEEKRKKEEERTAEELRRQIEEEARLQAEREWYAKEEQRKLKEAAQKEEARRIALEAKQKAEFEAKQKAELEAIRLAEEDRKAEQKRKAAEAKREVEAKRKAEEIKKAAEEARRKAEEEARLKKEEEVKRKAEEKKRQVEAKRLAGEKRKAEAARQAEAKRLADEKRKMEAQQQADLKRQTELERLAEEKRKADEAARQTEANFQAELQRQADEAERKAIEAAQKRKAEAELKRQAEEKAAAEAKLKAEREARLKAEAEARLKAEREAKLKAEAEAKAAAEAKRKADLLKRQKKAIEEVERRRQADLEVARLAKDEQERRAREHAERLKREAQAARKAEEEAIRRAMEEARVRREKEEAERLKREADERVKKAEQLQKEAEEAREKAEREEARKKAAEEVKRRKKAQRKAETEAEAKREAEAEAARVKAEGEAKLREMLGIQQVDNALTFAEQTATTPFHEQQMLLQEAWHQIDESLLLSQQAHNMLLRAQHHNSEAFRQLGEADLLLSLSQGGSAADCEPEPTQDAPTLISARHHLDEALVQAQEGYRLLSEAWDYHDASARTAEEGHGLLVQVGLEGEHARVTEQYSLVEARHHNEEAFRRAEQGRSALEAVLAKMGIPLHVVTPPPASHQQLSDPEREREKSETMSTTSHDTTTDDDDRPYEERLAAFINDQLVTYGVWNPESKYVGYDPRNPSGPRAHEVPVWNNRQDYRVAVGSDVKGVKEAWW